MFAKSNIGLSLEILIGIFEYSFTEHENDMEHDDAVDYPIMRRIHRIA